VIGGAWREASTHPKNGAARGPIEPLAPPCGSARHFRVPNKTWRPNNCGGAATRQVGMTQAAQVVIDKTASHLKPRPPAHHPRPAVGIRAVRRIQGPHRPISRTWSAVAWKPRSIPRSHGRLVRPADKDLFWACMDRLQRVLAERLNRTATLIGRPGAAHITTTSHRGGQPITFRKLKELGFQAVQTALLPPRRAASRYNTSTSTPCGFDRPSPSCRCPSTSPLPSFRSRDNGRFFGRQRCDHSRPYRPLRPRSVRRPLRTVPTLKGVFTEAGVLGGECPLRHGLLCKVHTRSLKTQVGSLPSSTGIASSTSTSCRPRWRWTDNRIRLRSTCCGPPTTRYSDSPFGSPSSHVEIWTRRARRSGEILAAMSPRCGHLRP